MERKQRQIEAKLMEDKKKHDENDLEKRRRIAERLKRMREIELEQEAMKKLTMQRMQDKLANKKKMKRIGGGFSVPYDLTIDEEEEIEKHTKVQNWMTIDNEESKDPLE
jgi:hypothetical protein